MNRTSRVATILAGSAVALGVAPVPAAAPASIRTEGVALVPALRGDGVLWSERDAGFTLKSAQFGGVPGSVQEFRPEAPFADRRSLTPALASSPSLVIASSFAYEDLGPAGGGRRPLYVEHYVGRPAGPLERIARCSGERTAFRSVDVSGEAYVYRQCDDDVGHVEVRDASLVPTSPPRSVGRGGFGARIAGRFVAWLDGPYSADDVPNDADVVVYDRVAGAEAYRIPRTAIAGRVKAIDVQDDGKVALAFDADLSDRDSRIRVAWASPQEPRVHLIALGAMDGYDVRIAGDRIAFQRARAPLGIAQDAQVGTVGLAGGARIASRRGDDDLFSEAFDYDGIRLVWREVGCERRQLVVHDPGVEAGAERPRVCALHLGSRPVVRRGAARLSLECGALQAPCTFTVRLRTAEHGRDRAAGEGSGGSPVRVRLTRAARRMLADRGSLRVTAAARIADSDGRTQTRRATFRLRR